MGLPISPRLPLLPGPLPLLLPLLALLLPLLPVLPVSPAGPGAPWGAAGFLAPAAAAAALPEAQAAASAGESALRRLSADLQSLDTFQAEFVQTQEWAGMEPSAPYRGTLSLMRPNLFRIEYADPAGHLQVSDGARVWTWIPENGEVLMADLQKTGSAGGDLLRWVLNNSRAEPHLETVELEGSPAEVLLLAPEEGLGVSGVRIWLRPGTTEIRQYEVVDSSGNRTLYRLTKIRRNPRLSPELFRFTPPSGVPVVEIGAP